MADARKTARRRGKPAAAAGTEEVLALVGAWTQGALKFTLALACLLAALVALRGVVPPSLAQTVVWTRWTVVPRGGARQVARLHHGVCVHGGGDHLRPAVELHGRVVVVGHARGHTARPLAADMRPW